jgi:hypothetical protein
MAAFAKSSWRRQFEFVINLQSAKRIGTEACRCRGSRFDDRMSRALACADLRQRTYSICPRWHRRGCVDSMNPTTYKIVAPLYAPVDANLTAFEPGTTYPTWIASTDREFTMLAASAGQAN